MAQRTIFSMAVALLASAEGQGTGGGLELPSVSIPPMPTLAPGGLELPSVSIPPMPTFAPIETPGLPTFAPAPGTAVTLPAAITDAINGLPTFAPAPETAVTLPAAITDAITPPEAPSSSPAAVDTGMIQPAAQSGGTPTVAQPTSIAAPGTGTPAPLVEMPPVGEVKTKSKIALAVISGLGLGVCGVDRCYMGSMCMGILKGCTLGGLGVWFFVDWCVILVNMLTKADSIDVIGYKANFKEGDMGAAFWITLVFLALKIISAIRPCIQGGGASPLDSEDESTQDADE